MKKFKRIFLCAFALLIMVVNTVSAEEITVEIKGKTTPGAYGVTVIMTDKNADVNNLKLEEIRWVDQYDVAADGSFSVKLPLLSSDEYDLYTNATSYNIYNPLEKNLTLYVSESGKDTNSGESADEPFATLAGAYSKLPYANEIVLMSDTDYTAFTGTYRGDLTIRGLTGKEKLNFTSVNVMNLTGNLKIDNLVFSGEASIYANGYNLEIGRNVDCATAVAGTGEGRLSVYGGKNGAAYTGDTNITLLGGSYRYIFGGCRKGTLTGNTNVVVGGNVNPLDSINDKSTTDKPVCYVYGGCDGGPVTGTTNIEFKENASAYFIFGAGINTTATAAQTNIVINGGKVMNVYGGSNGVELNGCDTHITMNSGMAEGIFGGCQNAAMKGNAYVTLLGGEVTRRVYSGCYNDMDISLSGAEWNTAYYVNGTTTLSLGPDVNLNTQTDLHTDNAVNIGVFACSRIEETQPDEHNMLIYLDNCYSAQNSKIGEKSKYLFVSLSNYLKNWVDYTVRCTSGGMVYGTATPATVLVEPYEGYLAKVGSGTPVSSKHTTTVSADTTITFSRNFIINNVSAKAINNKAKAEVSLIAENITNETKPCMYATLFDSATGRFMGFSQIDTTTDMNQHTFDFDCTLEAGKSYDIKVFIWNENQKPLTKEYHIILNN